MSAKELKEIERMAAEYAMSYVLAFENPCLIDRRKADFGMPVLPEEQIQ